MTGDPKELANDVHVKAVLVMLPYDADKFIEKSAMIKEHLGLQINGVPAEKLNLADRANVQHDCPVGSTVSFLDANKHRVYYKLIADSDAVHGKNDKGLYDYNDDGKPQNYAAGHDAAAFIEVDAKGNEIKKADTGKPHVIVTFPGMNNPFNHDFKDGARDRLGDTTYQEKFFNDFVSQLSPELAKRGMNFSQTEAISHSMGDKFALEYDARFGAKTMIIVGWDKEDSAIGAATRDVLREHLGEKLSDKEFEKEFAAKMQAMSHNVTEINAYGFHPDKAFFDAMTPLDSQTHEPVFGDQSYRVKDAGHTAAFYMNRNGNDFVKDKPADANALIEDALKHREETSSLTLLKFAQPSRAEESFLDVMENEKDAMKNAFEAKGAIGPKEKKALADFQTKIDAMSDQLYSFREHDNSMEVAAPSFIKPVDKDLKVTKTR